MRDELVTIEPENWTIVDDRLYLNHDDDVRAKREAEASRFIVEADRKFPTLLDE